MRSNLYGSKLRENPHDTDTRGSTKLHMEEQMHRENEAMLDALSHSVRHMNSMAGTLNTEVQEQNRLLSSLSGTFVTARAGVGTSITNLRGVMGRYGYRHIMYVIIGVFLVLYALYALLF
ncbi:unnamed protein product [Phytomonas sp. EM1]|nr:unnamed protein product [Phytomonas sp. EM1]|eukprot:CCW63470.1 unnamed protein product [Phytomonas sp. isolate EM1]